MVEVKKIIGRAGTGKTYTLIKEIESLFQAGYAVADMAMITHTRNGVQVFRSRMINNLKRRNAELKYFGTMHSLSWRRQGLKGNNIFKKVDEEAFLETYYSNMTARIDSFDSEKYYLSNADKARISGNSKIKAMAEIDNILSGCMITDNNFAKMHKMTGRTLAYTNHVFNGIPKWDDKRQKYVPVWKKNYEHISSNEQIKFSKNYREYLNDNDLFSHARNLEGMQSTRMGLPVRVLIFDEFQDFSKLQYEIFNNWKDYPTVEKVIIAGDDAQTIFRFASASAEYMITTPCDEMMKLKKTYRHGQGIVDNAQAMIDRMLVVEPVQIISNKKDKGEVIKCTGDEWKNVVDFSDPDETVLVLAATKKWVRDVLDDLHEVAPDTIFVNIEDTRVIKRVFGMYNVISALERGDDVPGENSIRSEEDIGEYGSVADLFSHSKTLPTSMFYNFPQKQFEKQKIKVLKNIKASIKQNRFEFRDTYTKETFEENFLKVPFSGISLVNAIPDITVFPQAPDIFPDFAETRVKKRIGTIHKSKGDEADTVLLFMGVPRPTLKSVNDTNVRDDVLREFYVGKTRPVKKLIEIYDYLRYGNGDIAPSIMELTNAPRCSNLTSTIESDEEANHAQ